MFHSFDEPLKSEWTIGKEIISTKAEFRFDTNYKVGRKLYIYSNILKSMKRSDGSKKIQIASCKRMTTFKRKTKKKKGQKRSAPYIAKDEDFNKI